MSDNRTQGSPDKLRRYHVGGKEPNGTGWGWGIFVIADDGYFSAITDFGSYAHFWGHAAKPMREFLIGLDSHYVAGKMMQGRKMEPDVEQTTKRVREYIRDRRREGGYTKEEAREEWDRLALLEDSLHEWMRETQLPDAYEFISEKQPAQVQAFAFDLFPRFQAALRAELAAEQNTEASVAT